MIIKTTFKSHFKIKKKLKSESKLIFVKNMLVFLLFSKIFFKNCSTNLLFNTTKKNQINFLKAPSRHKKFFHQTFFEFFQIKVFFKFRFNKKLHIYNTVIFFKKLNLVFLNLGSNLLTRTKFKTTIPFKQLNNSLLYN